MNEIIQDLNTVGLHNFVLQRLEINFSFQR